MTSCAHVVVVPDSQILLNNGDKVGDVRVELPDGYVGISKGYLYEMHRDLLWCVDELEKCKE